MPSLTEQDRQKLIAAIDRNPAFRTTGVAFIGRGMSQIVRQSSMPAGLQTWIVLKEEEVQQPASAPPPQPTSSSLLRELLNMGLSCGATFFAGVATLGAAKAAPLTAGTSLGVSVVIWSGALATAAQCGIAMGRVINEIFEPGSNESYLDSEEWYQYASTTLDAISVAGGVASLGEAAKAAMRLSRSTGRPLLQVLRHMSRAERKRLAQDLARYSGQAPTRRMFIRLAREGKIPKIFTRQQVTQAMINELLNSISSNLTFAGSANAGVIRQVAVYFVEDE
jgi:hypothetical protein